MPTKGKRRIKGTKVNLPKHPPGRIKIAEAFRLLMTQKEFNSITTSEIARLSGVNESLIYRYFGDKRGLMQQLILDISFEFKKNLNANIKKTKGALNKLKVLIRSHFDLYHADYAIAKILILEVRNYPGYFESESYAAVREYAQVLTDILEQGIRDHEIRDDLPVQALRQAVLGVIEHLCLPKVIYRKPYLPDELTDLTCSILFEGLKFRP